MSQILLSIYLLALIPGSYDPAIIGVDGSLITGYYQNCTGECKFSCNVYFEGRKTSDSFSIVAYYPGDTEIIPGTAQVTEKQLCIRLASLPDGCFNVEPDFNKGGVTLMRDTVADWLQIRIVKQSATLRAKLNGKLGAPVGKQQAVIVLRKTAGWFFVKKPGGEKTSGWIKESELFPLRTGPHNAADR